MTDEAPGQAFSIGVDDLPVAFQVAEALEAAATQVTAVWSHATVDQRVTRQQRPELELFATHRTHKRACGRRFPARGGM